MRKFFVVLFLLFLCESFLFSQIHSDKISQKSKDLFITKSKVQQQILKILPPHLKEEYLQRIQKEKTSYPGGKKAPVTFNRAYVENMAMEYFEKYGFRDSKLNNLEIEKEQLRMLGLTGEKPAFTMPDDFKLNEEGKLILEPRPWSGLPWMDNIQADPDDPYTLHVFGRSFDVRKGLPHFAQELEEVNKPGEGYYLIHFGTLNQYEVFEILQELKELDILAIEPLVHNGYILYGNAGAIESLASYQGVSFVGRYVPGFKIHPKTGLNPLPGSAATSEIWQLEVQVFPNQNAIKWYDILKGTGAVVREAVLTEYAKNFIIDIDYRQILTLAHQEGIRTISEILPKFLHNDTTPSVLQTGTFLNPGGVQSRPYWQAGLKGQGQMGAMLDDGLDVDCGAFAESTSTPGTPSATHRKVYSYTAYGGGDTATCSSAGSPSHGTFTTNLAMGSPSPINCYTTDGEGDGWPDADGIAYLGKVVFQDVASSTNCANGTLSPPTDPTTSLTNARNAGAFFQNNSWGGGTIQYYDSYAQALDQFMWTYQDFMVTISAGNTNGATIQPPATCKNDVTVGGTESWPDINVFYADSSDGPEVSGGRKGPQVMAPACDAGAAGGEAHNYPFIVYNEDSDYNTGPVTCTNASFTGWCGTSFSAPEAMGAMMLIRQYYVDGWYPTGAPVAGNGFTPSAALIKATLLASADFMPGNTGSVDRFDNNQGYGRINLKNALPLQGNPNVSNGLKVWDYGLTTPPSLPWTATFKAQYDGTHPLIVFLAWIDYPGENLVNNLNLRVKDPNNVWWYGNNFTGAWSNNGTTVDNLNPTEGIWIQPSAVVTGTYTIEVTGTITQSHPTYGGQPFAVIATGAVVGGSFIQLDKETYSCSGYLSLKVVDGAEPTISYVATHHTITTTLGDSETISNWTKNGNVYTSNYIPIVSSATATPNNGKLEYAEGNTITATYTDQASNTSTDTALVDCQIDVEDAGYLWAGGCDGDQYIDAGEDYVLTVGIYNNTGYDYNDGKVSINIYEAGTTNPSPYITVLENQPVDVGIIPSMSVVGVAFTLRASSSMPTFYRIDVRVNVTSPADGMTTPGTFTMYGNFRGSNPDHGQGNLESFYCNVDEAKDAGSPHGTEDSFSSCSTFTHCIPFDIWEAGFTSNDSVGWSCNTTRTSCGYENAGLWHTGTIGNAICNPPTQDGACPPTGCTTISQVYNSSNIVSQTFTMTNSYSNGWWSTPRSIQYYNRWTYTNPNFFGFWLFVPNMASNPSNNLCSNEANSDWLGYWAWGINEAAVSWGSSDGTYDWPSGVDPQCDGTDGNIYCMDGNKTYINLGWFRGEDPVGNIDRDYPYESYYGILADNYSHTFSYTDCNTTYCGNNDTYGWGLDRVWFKWDELHFIAQQTTCNTSNQIGQVKFDLYSYQSCANDVVTITLTDQNANTNPSVAETYNVTVWSGAEPLPGETVTLTETDVNTGIFKGGIPINNVYNKSGVLFVSNSDSMWVRYTDTNPSGTSEDHAWVECAYNCLDLKYNGATFTDNGDNDGFADAYETVTMTIKIFNNEATTTAKNVQVQVWSDSQYIDCFIDDTASFGNIDPQTEKAALDTIQFHVKSTADCNKTATLYFNITADNANASCTQQTLIIQLSRNWQAGTFSEDFEGTDPATDGSGWSHMTIVGDDPSCELAADPWTWTTRYKHAGTYAYGFPPSTGNYADQISAILVTPVLKLNTGTHTFSFWHYILAETDWDGGILQYSKNYGPWTKVTNQNTAYNGNINGGYCSQLGAEAVWWQVGSTTNFTNTTTNVDAYAAAGDIIQFRWWFASDVSGHAGTNEGWFIDDVSLNNVLLNVCQTTFNTSLPGCACVGALPPDFKGIKTAQDLDECEDTGVQITWDPVTAWNSGSCSNTGTYRVLRDGTPIASGLTGTSYTDNTGTNGVTYTYSVLAVNSAGLSFDGNKTLQAGDFDLVCGGAAPGSIYKNSSSAAKFSKSGSNIVATWGPPGGTCSPTDYAIYQGTIGNWYSHNTVITCSAGTDFTETFATPAGDVYFLIVPISATEEGSYGTNSNSQERPVSANRCKSTQNLTSCN